MVLRNSSARPAGTGSPWNVTIPTTKRSKRVEAEAPPEALAQTHSPRFVGRAIVALATDPKVAQHTGGVFKVGQLGLDYGFTDVDGTQPAPFSISDE